GGLDEDVRNAVAIAVAGDTARQHQYRRPPVPADDVVLIDSAVESDELFQAERLGQPLQRRPALTVADDVTAETAAAVSEQRSSDRGERYRSLAWVAIVYGRPANSEAAHASEPGA